VSRGSRVQRLAYFVRDAWDEWRHSPGANLLATGTLVSALFVAGLVALVLINVDRHLAAERGSVQVHVYLQDALEPQARDALARELERTSGVAHVEYVDRDEALRRYRAWAERSAALVEEIELNPLPASLEVTLAGGPGTEKTGDALVAGLVGRPEVEDVRFDRDWLERIEALVAAARLGSIALGLLVSAAVVVVMASVLRLAVHARREEIEIMQLVGATPGFVRGPFLVTGLVQGIGASVAALLALELARRSMTVWLGSEPLALVGLATALPLPGGAAFTLSAVGVLVSITAAFFAVRRPV
jgi:cell division transport system permease protein